jgi:putative hydrolase of the HAD superfamily
LHNRRYEQVFFDLDHTLWDFETNSRETLMDLYVELALQEKGIGSFDEFHRIYQHHNLVFWDRFRKGFIKRDELRWKRMWRTLLDFQIGDEADRKSTRLNSSHSGSYSTSRMPSSA